jgi:hypothetical protein
MSSNLSSVRTQHLWFCFQSLKNPADLVYLPNCKLSVCWELQSSQNLHKNFRWHFVADPYFMYHIEIHIVLKQTAHDVTHCSKIVTQCSIQWYNVPWSMDHKLPTAARHVGALNWQTFAWLHPENKQVQSTVHPTNALMNCWLVFHCQTAGYKEVHTSL